MNNGGGFGCTGELNNCGTIGNPSQGKGETTAAPPFHDSVEVRQGLIMMLA